VKVLAGHDGGTGCAWYRMEVPLRELGRHNGHEVTVVAAGTEAARSRPGQYDIIAAERLSENGQMGTWRRLSAHGRLVYELDDDCFSVEPANWQAYSTFTRADVQDAIAHCAEVADLVTVSTQPLAEVMGKFNPNTVVLPNFIPGWVLDLPERPRRDHPRAGWMGGSSHGRDIQMIAAPLRRFLDRHPGWDGWLAGVDFRPAVRHRRTGFTPWIQVNTDPESFYSSIDFDIGLAPLMPSAFNRSKSYIKALEYAARGIPVIATDWEPYRDFVIHGVTGFLIPFGKDHLWLRYMSELAADEGLRESMGAKAKEHARQFTIEGNWDRWENAYQALL
jgi:glycosyltransferase involved in cell wall biosynthesis